MSAVFFADQVSEQRLSELLSYRFEADDLDFKEKVDLSQKKDAVELCKDIIAMANSRGGYIVLGVEDETFLPVGLDTKGTSAHIDTADVANLVYNYVDARIEVVLSYHTIPCEGEARLFGIMYVAPSTIPVVTTKTGAYQTGNRQITVFQQGEWLVRSGTRSQRASPAEVAELLQKRQAPGSSHAALAQPRLASHSHPIVHNLPRPNFSNFIGRQQELKRIREALDHERAWLVTIEGTGGVGKTALAQKVALDLVSRSFQLDERKWEYIIWMSAKETILDVNGTKQIDPGFRNLTGIFDTILAITGFQSQQLVSLEDKRQEAMDVLKTFRCLLIIDNLETVKDDTVERFLTQEIPPPSKAVITGRFRTEHIGGLTVSLMGLDKELGVQLLREAADYQGSAIIRSAPQSKLESIVELAAGNPLALRLVVGQTALGTDLTTVLERLTSRKAPILEFCFRETYRDLSAPIKKLLGAVSLFDSPATLDELAMVSNLPNLQVSEALVTLAKLSFVQEEFDSTRDATTYGVLPLTRAFARDQFAEMADSYEATRRRLSLYNLRRQQLLVVDRVNLESVRRARARTELERIAVGLADLAEAKYKSDDYKGAIGLLEEAQILAPRLAYVQQVWAYIERREGHVLNARQRYRRAVELDPKDLDYYRYWATLEGKTGNHKDSAELYREVLLLKPDDVDAMKGLANALLKHAKRNPNKRADGLEMLQEALLIIEAAFESSPQQARSDIGCWRVKAEILLELRRPRQAFETCEMALNITYDQFLADIKRRAEQDLKHKKAQPNRA